MGKLLNKFYLKRKKGFTLFEVLIIVVILVVLVSIALPTYNKIIKKSRVADGLHVLDMLANAQDKYYVEHGFYSQSLTALNAPFKEYRVPNPNSPYTDIITTNFTYDKKPQKHCITANANLGGSYTLVKNYKTKDKVVCFGPDCSNISDYVSEIGEDALLTLCPNEIQCTLTQDQCGNEHFWPAPICDCNCSEEDYQNCINGGGVFTPNCYCLGTQTPCDENIPHTVNDICGAYMVTDCNKQLCDPCNPSGYVLPPQRGEGGNPTPFSVSCCGWQLPDHNRVECVNGQWLCVNTEDACNEFTGDEGQDCDGTDSIPEATPGNTCGMKIFQGCNIDHLCDPSVVTTCQLKDGNACFTGQTKACNLASGGSGTQTCTEDCMWGDCQENPCSGPRPSDEAGDCMIKKWNCEKDDANPDGGYSWFPYYEPLPGTNNECETGDQRPCPENPDLIQICQDCLWTPCGEQEPCGPKPSDMPVPNTEGCMKASPVCVKNEETNEWEWQYPPNQFSWVTDYGEDNCITGQIRSCNNPVEGCTGSSGRGVGNGGGGGRGMVEPCCDSGCQRNCEKSCKINGQIPDNWEECVNNCIEANGGRCSGGNQGGGGGGGNSNCIPPAQGCPMGQIWNQFSCTCIYSGGGGGNGGGGSSGPTQICQDCHWSCCSYCNFAEKPDDYTSQCAVYKTQCHHASGEITTWVSGKDYYDACILNNECSFAEWFGDNQCETGKWRPCDNGQGRQYCNGCHWGECGVNYTITNITGVAMSGKAYYCPDGIQNTMLSGDCNSGSSDYTICTPDGYEVCKLYNSVLLPSCGNSDYYSYCRTNAGGKCLISGDTSSCGYTTCDDYLCDPDQNPGWQAPPQRQEEFPSCARAFTVLNCN